MSVDEQRGHEEAKEIKGYSGEHVSRKIQKNFLERIF